jgi:hypothetical protein
MKNTLANETAVFNNVSSGIMFNSPISEMLKVIPGNMNGTHLRLESDKRA